MVTSFFSASTCQYPRWKGILCWVLLLFYIPASLHAQPNISRLEYYIDIDPGFGNATSLSIGTGTDLPNLTIPINPTALAEGVHRLYVRAKSANGWSLTNTWLFYKPIGGGGAVLPAPNLSKLEYYIDTDPGFGNATALSIGTGTNFADLIIPINPTALAEGVHRLYVRAKSANGWSLTNTWLFYKPISGPGGSGGLVLPKLRKLEYFIDNDPGYGNATPVVLDSFTNFADYIVPINVTGLASGVHNFWLRGLDKNGHWSLMNRWIFTVPTLLVSPSIVVNSITGSTVCSKDSISISYDATGTYNAGNIFNVQLSDAAGSFASPVIIGSYTGTSSAIIPCKLPNNVIGGTNFRIRVSSTNPVVTGLSNSNALTIGNKSLPQPITGAVHANGSYNYGYNIPAVTGSTWNWIISGGTQQSGSNTNSIGLIWSQPPVNTTTQGIIKLVETNYGCMGDTSILNATVYRLRIGISTATTACKAFAMAVTASADGTFGAGNILTAQLSDAAGSFTSPVVIGTTPLVGNGLNQPAVINTTIPAATPNGNNYRVRIISTTGTFIGDTSTAIIIQKPNIGADTTIYHNCPGETTNLIPLYSTTGLTALWNTGTPTAAPPGVYRLIVTNGTGCSDTAFANIVLEVATWTGNTSNNWHTASNWNISKVPGQQTHVIIPSGTVNPCNVSAADAEAASIQVKTGATLTMNNNRKLLSTQKCTSLPPN